MRVSLCLVLVVVVCGCVPKPPDKQVIHLYDFEFRRIEPLWIPDAEGGLEVEPLGVEEAYKLTRQALQLVRETNSVDRIQELVAELAAALSQFQSMFEIALRELDLREREANREGKTLVAYDRLKEALDHNLKQVRIASEDTSRLKQLCDDALRIMGERQAWNAANELLDQARQMAGDGQADAATTLLRQVQADPELRGILDKYAPGWEREFGTD